MFNSSENLARSYSFKGTLSWLSKVHAIYIWLTEPYKSLIYIQIFKKILNLIFKRMIQRVHTCLTEGAGVRIENLDQLNNETIEVSHPRW